jgi:hypothetical protein
MSEVDRALGTFDRSSSVAFTIRFRKRKPSTSGVPSCTHDGRGQLVVSEKLLTANVALMLLVDTSSTP